MLGGGRRTAQFCTSAPPLQKSPNHRFCCNVFQERKSSLNSGFSKHAFREVPFGFRRGRGTVLPQECPKISPKKRTWYQPRRHVLYPKVLIAKCLPGGAEGPYQGQPLSPRKSFKNVLGTRLEGTFECKARLENADKHKVFGQDIPGTSGTQTSGYPQTKTLCK